MAQQKTFAGARALVYIEDQLVGLFESCQRGVNLGTEAIHTLGRFSAHEIAITSYEAVSVQCSGFRIIGQGVHVLPKAPKLQDLLTFNRIRISVVDRQSGSEIMNVQECVPANWNEGDQAKAISRLSITFIGTVMGDESGAQSESQGASELP